MKWGISKANLSKWKKNKPALEAAVHSEVKAIFKKLRPASKHTGLHKRLYKVFSKARDQGKKVSLKWLHIKFLKKIHAEMTGKDPKSPGPSCFNSFLRNY